MPEEPLIIFRKFHDFTQAKAFSEDLTTKGIANVLVDNSPTYDISFSGNTLQNEVIVKIKKSDFELANSVMQKQSEMLAETIDDEHYLYEFSDEELYDVLLKSDEWTPLDYQISQNILKKRGKPVDDQFLDKLKYIRLQELSEPDKSKPLWIIFAGYGSAILGGFLGIYLGWFLWRFKKTLPDGKKVLAHNEVDRMHGKIIFFFGTIAFIFSMYFYFYSLSQF